MNTPAREAPAGTNAALIVRRRLIINADDFGRSNSINRAVIRAHDEGILTTASLMVNEAACQEAVELAHAHPTLGVGLHLALLCGQAALHPSQIPGLVDRDGQFSHNPVTVGWRYFWQPKLREQLRAEIHAQFDRFRATGLPLDHVNGHLHLHLHPAIFGILMEDRARLGIVHLRLTCDPFCLNLRLVRGRWIYRSTHALMFGILARRVRPRLLAGNIRHTARVFGVLQDSHVDEAYVLALLRSLPLGDSELYSHPSLDEFKHELDALVSPRVRALIDQLGIQRIRYQDL